jgi:secondary thiamine-phosphate synthase enzyme
MEKDMDMALDRIVPESLPWRHTDEGPDDSASHTKATLVGSSISVPITNGRLNMGTWQGVYLTEFREMPHSMLFRASSVSTLTSFVARKLVATILP